MARRTGLSREELYNNAIAAGSALISQHGLTNFSMRQIAREIGYTVGTLYNVFKNQDDLLLRINAKTLEELYQFIRSKISPNLYEKNILRVVAISYFTFAKDNYLRWKVLFEYNMLEENYLPEWYMEKIGKLIELAEQSLSRLKLSEAEIRKSSRIMWAGVHGICVLSLSGKLALTKSNDAEDLINEFVEKYFVGINKNINALINEY